jgi:hypothetical protein
VTVAEYSTPTVAVDSVVPVDQTGVVGAGGTGSEKSGTVTLTVVLVRKDEPLPETVTDSVVELP